MPNKVQRQGFFGWEDFLPVTTATVATSWLPGMFFQVDTTNGVNAVLFTNAGNTLPYGVALDSSTELTTPPSASQLTLLHGYAKVLIQGGGTDVTNPWNQDVPSATVNTKLYASSSSKWTTVSGSVTPFPLVGTLFQVPTVANAQTMGVLLRI